MKTIKSIILTSLIFLFTAVGLYAQHFSYVDTEYILDKMPEYKSAQKQLDNLAEQWKKEVDVKMKDVDKLYNQYQ